LNPVDINNLKNNPNFNVIQVPGAFIRYIIFNTAMNPVSDLKVRQALAATINRSDIANRVFIGTIVQGRPVNFLFFIFLKIVYSVE